MQSARILIGEPCGETYSDFIITVACGGPIWTDWGLHESL